MFRALPAVPLYTTGGYGVKDFWTGFLLIWPTPPTASGILWRMLTHLKRRPLCCRVGRVQPLYRLARQDFAEIRFQGAPLPPLDCLCLAIYVPIYPLFSRAVPNPPGELYQGLVVGRRSGSGNEVVKPGPAGLQDVLCLVAK